MARRIYHVTPERERDGKKKQLAKILSVSEDTVYRWLARIDKDTKESNQKRAFELWLECRTLDEISETIGVAKKTIDDWLSPLCDFRKLPNSAQSDATHATDFKPPIYNVWKQQEKTPGSNHLLRQSLQ